MNPSAPRPAPWEYPFRSHRTQEEVRKAEERAAGDWTVRCERCDATANTWRGLNCQFPQCPLAHFDGAERELEHA